MNNLHKLYEGHNSRHIISENNLLKNDLEMGCYFIDVLFFKF